jgi:hypothetical protein
MVLLDHVRFAAHWGPRPPRGNSQFSGRDYRAALIYRNRQAGIAPLRRLNKTGTRARHKRNMGAKTHLLSMSGEGIIIRVSGVQIPPPLPKNSMTTAVYPLHTFRFASELPLHTCCTLLILCRRWVSVHWWSDHLSACRTSRIGAHLLIATEI